MEHYQEDMSLSMNLNDLLGRTPEAQICGSTPYSLCMLIPFNLATKFGIVTVGAGYCGVDHAPASRQRDPLPPTPLNSLRPDVYADLV